MSKQFKELMSENVKGDDTFARSLAKKVHAEKFKDGYAIPLKDGKVIMVTKVVVNGNSYWQPVSVGTIDYDGDYKQESSLATGLPENGPTMKIFAGLSKMNVGQALKVINKQRV